MMLQVMAVADARAESCLTGVKYATMLQINTVAYARDDPEL